MQRFLHIIDVINENIGRYVNYLVLVIIIVTIIEVVGRFVFDRPTIWAHETAGQLFGFYAVIGGGYALLHKIHLRIDIFWGRLTPRGRAIADLITCVFSFLFLGALFWSGVTFAAAAVKVLERSVSPFAPPLYPLKICLVIGVALLILQLLAKTIRDISVVAIGAKK